jgi:hypothetical protein
MDSVVEDMDAVRELFPLLRFCVECDKMKGINSRAVIYTSTAFVSLFDSLSPPYAPKLFSISPKRLARESASPESSQ